MKRKNCDNEPPGSLGIMCWLHLVVLEALAFGLVHPSLQKFDHCPYEVERCPSGNQ